MAQTTTPKNNVDSSLIAFDQDLNPNKGESKGQKHDQSPALELTLQEKRDLFKSAYNVRNRSSQVATLLEAQQTMPDYLLSDYLELWALLTQLKSNVDDVHTNLALQAFIAKHQGSYLAERAASDYIMIAKDRLNPLVFNSLYEKLVWNKTETPIYAWYLYYNLDSKPQLIEQAKAFLLSSNVSGDPLVALGLKLIAKDKSYTQPLLLIIAQKQRWKSLRTIIQQIDDKDFPAKKSLTLQLTTAPKKWLKQNKKSVKKLSPLNLELMTLRLARIDPELTAKFVQEHQKLFNKNHLPVIWATIAHEGSSKLIPESADWYKRAGAYWTNPLLANRAEHQAWAARAYLRKGYWSSLKRGIEAMTTDLRNQEPWRYWYARTLVEHNQVTKANHIFKSLSNNLSYYGVLSREQLGLQPHKLAQTPVKVDPELRKKFEENESFKKALEFYEVEMYSEGNREWNWALKDFPRQQWVQFAEIGKEIGITHRMINTSMSSHKKWDQFDQRFPMPYQELVTDHAELNGINQAWVYGIMRQESRFMQSVKSSVGAMGLMQIMPNTGKWLAKKNDITDFQVQDIFDPKTNITLGTIYLALLLDNFDSEKALATAAYNAGPAKVRQWRKKITTPLEGSIFIESIPYYETRDYVKNVLFNAYIYDLLMNKPGKLSDKVGTIQPESSAKPYLP